MKFLLHKMFYYLKQISQQTSQLEDFLGIYIPTDSKLRKAVIHCQQHGYERLEFLGDSILGSIVAEYLFQQYPNAKEGKLSVFSARLISRNTLYKVGLKNGIQHLIQSNTIDFSNENGNKRIIGDVVESLIGSIYFEYGYLAAKKVAYQFYLNDEAFIDNILTTTQNFKGELLEKAQKLKFNIDFQITEISNGFEATISVNNKMITKGVGTTKKEAEQLAAKRAITQQFWVFFEDKF